MKKPTGFLGTYYDRDAVLRLERWVRIIAWITLVVYVIEAGSNAFQIIYNAVIGGFPLDWFFVFTTVSRVFVGGVLFMLLYVAAKVMLILLDIEDNTRRAARVNTKEN